MTPVLGAVRSGFRRRVPVLVTGLVLLVSSAASVLGLALAVDSNAPFDQAFAAQRGADAVVTAQATAAGLATTRRLPEVTAAAGPFAEVTVTVRLAGRPGPTLPPLTLAGRATPGGPVDDLVIQSGHWARGPGQVVLSSSDENLPPLPLGTQLTVTGRPGTLTVVGMAASVTGSADGWVTPATAAALHPVAAQLLYRFRSAGTAAAVRADVAAVAAALPPHAIGSALSWLTVRAEQEPGIAPIAPFLIAFGVTGLVLSVLIVINVVSGAVLAGYRRIGILKSLGFTPGQVAAAYTSQAMIPAAAGCLAGLVIGNLLAGPLLGRAATVYGVATLGVPAWVNAAVPGALLGLTGLAALLPAVRASPAQRDRGHRGRPGPGGRPGLPGAPAAGPAAAAPAGDDRAGRAVRPPGPDRGHPGRGAGRRDRGDAGGRPGRLAEPAGVRADAEPHRAGRGPGPAGDRREVRSGPRRPSSGSSPARCTTWPRPMCRPAWPAWPSRCR